jgi:hypothetical protein
MFVHIKKTPEENTGILKYLTLYCKELNSGLNFETERLGDKSYELFFGCSFDNCADIKSTPIVTRRENCYAIS